MLKDRAQLITIAVVTCVAVFLGITTARSEFERYIVEREAAIWQARTDTLLGIQKQDYEARIAGLMASVEREKAKADSLVGLTAKARSEAYTRSASTKAKLDSIGVIAATAQDSLDVLFDVVAEMQQTESYYQETISLQEQTIDALQFAISQMEEVLSAAKLRIGDLEYQLSTVPKPKSCKLLGFIPCPSRTTSALLGAIVGGVATAAVVNR